MRFVDAAFRRQGERRRGAGCWKKRSLRDRSISFYFEACWHFSRASSNIL